MNPDRDIAEIENNVRGTSPETWKILRVTKGIKCYADYFDPRKTSSTADKLQGYLKFLAMEARAQK